MAHVISTKTEYKNPPIMSSSSNKTSQRRKNEKPKSTGKTHNSHPRVRSTAS